VASAPLQVREVAPPPAVSTPATTPAPLKPTVTTAPGSALRVTATADTWVEVADAQGQLLVSRVLREGEQQEYSGAAPYKVRVGNVRGTRLEWRGAAVDLAARATNNVARLELN
jgi:cytoskeleton protein RodZ